ncbi:hypothetical protein BKA93DRAFT_32872 [Sparassis latifolia]
MVHPCPRSLLNARSSRHDPVPLCTSTTLCVGRSHTVVSACAVVRSLIFAQQARLNHLPIPSSPLLLYLIHGSATSLQRIFGGTRHCMSCYAQTEANCGARMQHILMPIDFDIYWRIIGKTKVVTQSPCWCQLHIRSRGSVRRPSLSFLSILSLFWYNVETD